MGSNYGKLVAFRFVTVLINLLLLRIISIPFDFIALVIGIWAAFPGMRIVIFILEVFNLMIALLSFFFGNIAGGLLGVATSGICLYVLCMDDVKERFS